MYGARGLSYPETQHPHRGSPINPLNRQSGAPRGQRPQFRLPTIDCSCGLIGDTQGGSSRPLCLRISERPLEIKPPPQKTQRGSGDLTDISVWILLNQKHFPSSDFLLVDFVVLRRTRRSWRRRLKTIIRLLSQVLTSTYGPSAISSSPRSSNTLSD